MRPYIRQQSLELVMTFAVAGASGFVGRSLVEILVDKGHQVVALSRSPDHETSGARSLVVDIADETSTRLALSDVDTAYYLVHSMAGGGDFRQVDLQLATTFGRAAAGAGVDRIVYVGGLGDSPTSAHLASRHEVGAALGAAGVGVVELRAAVVFGPGSISFEMLRYLTERLPAMVCPRWVRTRIQPIALSDLLAYLVQAPGVAPGVYEIGGAESTTYRELISEYARVRGLRKRLIFDIPWLTPHLSSYWVDLVTPVDRTISHRLIESLVTEVVVVDPEPARRAFTVVPMGIGWALSAALDEQDDRVTRSMFSRRPGLLDGVYTVVATVGVPPGADDAVAQDLESIGGRFSWYGARVGWWVRVALGHLVGEDLRRGRDQALTVGAHVDWWRVARAEPGVLVLRSEGWMPGDAWLGYRVHDGMLHQVAAFRSRGVPGFLYWKLLDPIHRMAFAMMLHHRLRSANAEPSSSTTVGSGEPRVPL